MNFKGKKISNIINLGFGEPGFNNILLKLKKIKDIRNFLVLNAFVYSENCDHINYRIKVFEIDASNKSEMEKVLQKTSEAFWLGSLPKAGYYLNLYPPGFEWLFKKRGLTAGHNGHPIKNELAALILPKLQEIQSSKKIKLLIENMEESTIGFGTLLTPNCDYFNLPEWVDCNENLMKWIGMPQRPIKKTKENQAGEKNI